MSKIWLLFNQDQDYVEIRRSNWLSFINSFLSIDSSQLHPNFASKVLCLFYFSLTWNTLLLSWRQQSVPKNVCSLGYLNINHKMLLHIISSLSYTFKRLQEYNSKYKQQSKLSIDWAHWFLPTFLDLNVAVR